MSAPNLDEFMSEVMNLSAEFTGTSGATSSFMGTSTTDRTIMEDLRNKAVDFAEAYQSTSATPKSLEKPAKELEGAILGMQITNAISEGRVNELVAKLDALVKAHSQQA